MKSHTTNEEHHPTTQHFPVTHDQGSTSEPPHSTTEKHVPTTTHHSIQSSEGVTTTTQLPRNEQTTTDADANADSSSGGQHGPGVAVIAGVSVTVVYSFGGFGSSCGVPGEEEDGSTEQRIHKIVND